MLREDNTCKIKETKWTLEGSFSMKTFVRKGKPFLMSVLILC